MLPAGAADALLRNPIESRTTHRTAALVQDAVEATEGGAGEVGGCASAAGSLSPW